MQDGTTETSAKMLERLTVQVTEQMAPISDRLAILRAQKEELEAEIEVLDEEYSALSKCRSELATQYKKLMNNQAISEGR